MICKGTVLPIRKNKGDAGIDFFAPYEIELAPGRWTDIDTGISLEDGDLAEGTCLMLVPRSGLGVKYGTRFRNTVGIVDRQYRDPIRACMTSDVPLRIHQGERFMQGIIVQFGTFPWEQEPEHERQGGFGSTGLK